MHEPRGPPLKVVVLQYSRHARIPTGRSNERLNEGAREGPPSKAGGAEDPVFDGLLSSSPGVEPRPTPSAPTSARPAHREPAIVGATVHGRRTLRGESILGNDPSAGSPTKTLLRLLLPLSDQVRFDFFKNTHRSAGCETYFRHDHSNP